MELKRIATDTTWENAVSGINSNNTKISEAVMRLEHATYKNKGYFKTEEQLLSSMPSPSVGSKAYVGINYPYKVYIVEDGAWVDSGETGGDESLNLEGYFTREEFENLVKDLPQDEFDYLREQGLLDTNVEYNTYEE